MHRCHRRLCCAPPAYLSCCPEPGRKGQHVLTGLLQSAPLAHCLPDCGWRALPPGSAAESCGTCVCVARCMVHRAVFCLVRSLPQRGWWHQGRVCVAAHWPRRPSRSRQWPLVPRSVGVCVPWCHCYGVRQLGSVVVGRCKALKARGCPSFVLHYACPS